MNDRVLDRRLVTVDRDGVPVPEGFHDGKSLLKDPDSIRNLHAENVEFFEPVPETDADFEATIAQPVENSDLFGELDRLMNREGVGHRSHPHCFGPLDDRRNPGRRCRKAVHRHEMALGGKVILKPEVVGQVRCHPAVYDRPRRATVDRADRSDRYRRDRKRLPSKMSFARIGGNRSRVGPKTDPRKSGITAVMT